MTEEKQRRKIYFWIGITLVVMSALEILHLFLDEGVKGFVLTPIENILLFLLGTTAVVFGMVASHIKEIKASIVTHERRIQE